MADPRLRYTQVAAPNFNAASAALARANDSFSSGIGSAQDIIGKYTQGVTDKADNELVAELAGLKYEDDFGAFVDGGGLQGRNISAGLRDTVLGMRGTLLGNDSTRAGTEGTRARTDATRASTSRANAAEGRIAFDFNDRVARQNALRNGAGLGVQADSIGRVAGNGEYQLGQSGSNTGVQRQVYDGLLARGLPEHVAQGFMLNFQDESGFNIGIEEGEPNVHGTRGKGLYQLTGTRRDAFEAKYGNDYSVDNQLDFLMDELRGSESAAAQAIFNTQNAGEAGAAIVSSFLRPAEEHRARRSAAYQGQTFTRPADINETRGPGSALTAYQQYLIDTGLFSAQEIQGESAPIRAAQNAGQAQIDAADAALVEEIKAAATLDALQNPNNVNPSQVVTEIGQNPNLTASEILDTVQSGGATAASPAGQALLAPQTTIDPATQSIADLTNAAAQATIDSTGQANLVSDIPAFAEDPAGTLISQLGLGTDGENPGGIAGFFGAESGLDPNQVRNLVSDYARKFNVTDEVAAVAMRKAFVRDPTGRNTLRNRFDEETVGQIIEAELSQGSIDAYREKNEVATQLQAQTNNILSQIQTLQSQAAKPGADQQALGQQIAALTLQLTQLRSQNNLTAGPAQ